MPRIVICAYDNPENISGPNVWLKRLLPRLKAVGLKPEVWFFTLDLANSPTADYLTKKGIETFRFPLRSKTREKVLWLLRQAESRPPAVFVPNHVVPAYFAARWIRQAGIPTVGVIHSDDNFYHAVVREFAGQSETWRVTTLVCVSSFLEKVIAPQVHCSVRIYKIPYGVPVPSLVAERPSEDLLKLAFAGRLQEEQKRVSEVALAFCRATREIPGVFARIIGDGPSMQSLRKLIRKQGCENRVLLSGRLESDRIQSELLQEHVFVLLSDYEGLPIALMESMACGLVPLCLRIESGIPELVQHGKNGLLVNDRGDGFISAVQTLRDSPDLWSHLSVSARQTIESKYSMEQSANKWYVLLSQLSNDSSKRRTLVTPQEFRLPSIQREFTREDFRIHPMIARMLARFRQFASSS